jgi:hypothetical protein
MSDSFAIRIILPEKDQFIDKSSKESIFDASELIDDDPNLPAFLFEACSAFAIMGVRFEIVGFFKELLPVSTRDDLVYLLKNLPSLFAFIEDETLTEFELGFWDQSIQTVFLFYRLANNEFEVRCSSKASFALEKETETISFMQLVGQMVAIADAYREALMRFSPRVLNEPWNQKLFTTASRLKNQLRTNSK